jgi:hypothetical protein
MGQWKVDGPSLEHFSLAIQEKVDGDIKKRPEGLTNQVCHESPYNDKPGWSRDIAH